VTHSASNVTHSASNVTHSASYVTHSASNVTNSPGLTLTLLFQDNKHRPNGDSDFLKSI